MTVSNLYVATANTHDGRMLESPGGFAALQHVDVLLMQEVLDLPNDARRSLEIAGFEVVHEDMSTGLAIALSANSAFDPVADTQESVELSAPLWDGAARYDSRLLQRLRARAAIGLTVRNRYTHSEVMVATAHPVVPVRPLARASQVRKLGDWLAALPACNAVLGADMNHYPTPGNCDRELEITTGMQRVDIGNVATWHMEGSNSERIGRILGLLSGLSLASFDGQLDAMLYRGDLGVRAVHVEDIASDHRAIVTQFDVPQPGTIVFDEGRP